MKVVAIVGPSISDNGLIVRELADDAGVACINYTGGALTGMHMFHYQVGSLEEEPVLLADTSARGSPPIAVLYDDTPVGTSLRPLARARRSQNRRPGARARSSVSPLAEDLRTDVDAAPRSSPTRSCTSGWA
jgi:hypothetical protein